MEKRLRSSLQTSAEEFLSSAAKLPFKSSKSAIKTLINTSVKPASDLTSSLPLALCNSISHSISRYKNLHDSTFAGSPVTPPPKRARRSSRNKKEDGVSSTQHRENGRQSIVGKLQVYAYILRLCVFHPKSAFSVSDLLPAAQELHDNLILFESDSILLSEIASLCEEWWKGDLLGKETLISQSLPVMLSRSLTLKKKIDVHRVYTLREAFMLFDFEDESIEDLKHLLIRCVISPLYLKTEEGRKFIAFMFGFSVQLMKEVCAMIKSQIPFGRKSMLEAYGEIFFRAWKAAEGECKYEIENRFLQGLIEGAIYASSAALAASIRRILGGFVSNRTTEGAEKLIFCLAEPIIFRSLQVANSNVRQNALHLLLDLFPLEDPDATKEAKDTLLEKQFFLLDKLLMDECPDVRAVAVEGSCRILYLFWEVIPSPIITKNITRIFDDMAHDACTEVRLSTVNGVIYLLGNPQSHEVLKVLLPRLGNLIMDSTSAVRAAVADLLLLLNDIRNFHFHKVVSIDILVSTLANDQPLVARKITKLLIPSYFPSKVMEEEACKRMITLIKRSPTAGARFCEFAALEGASLRSLMKLFKVLSDLIMSSVKLDEEIVEGLLVASHLCTNLAKDASFEPALREELSAEKLKTFFTVASTSHVIERQAEMRSAHKMILSCGWFDDMFGVLVGCLQKAACGCHAKFGVELGKQNVGSAIRRTKSSTKVSSKSKHCNGQRSSNTDINRFRKIMQVLLVYHGQIKELLLHENSRKAMLGSRHLESAYSALKVISEASVLYCLQYDYLNTWSVSAYTTLTLHMSLHNIKTDASISDLTLDHLLHCANNVFRANHNNTSDNDSLPSESLNSTNAKIAPGYSTDSGECQTGTSLTKQLRISNMVKMLTAVLKFVADATAMNLVTRSQDRCLNFTTENVKFIITNLRERSIAQPQITEEDLKDIFICLKSSLTYSSKLLNIMLKACGDSSCQAGAYSLVNELFNLIVSVEEFLGYGYAARLVTVIQPWVPDMILALGSNCLGKQTPDNGVCSDSSENAAFHLPSWFYILARVELCEQRDKTDDDTEEDQHAKDFSAFKRLVETMSMLLKSNNKILDAVGVIFLTGSLSALQSKKFDLVLGLLHFVSVKLVSPEDTEWKELKLMLASIEEIYPKVEREAEELGNNESDRQKLYSAKALLEPVWASFIYDDRRHSMEEE
ncbi:UNVERIFIED_CONTAM: Condensin-2 complex subunit G2 [Sesamum calycinum]|uniref:Condensin-2 complex subunit G2 n=1 Tax=Sesamum calycinum TaxID=2727403 RepID=A0AAW2MPA3_9LAMI